MVKTLDTAEILEDIDLDHVRVMNLRNGNEDEDDKELSLKGMVEYTCDAVCKNCHCATYAL